MDELLCKEDGTHRIHKGKESWDIHKPWLEVRPVYSENKGLCAETEDEQCFLRIVEFKDEGFNGRFDGAIGNIKSEFRMILNNPM